MYFQMNIFYIAAPLGSADQFFLSGEKIFYYCYYQLLLLQMINHDFIIIFC